MSYKTPIVCKDVYLPIDYDWMGTVSEFTFDEYKERYGIDLSDIFIFNSVEDVRLKPFIKAYFVIVSDLDLFSGKVIPIEIKRTESAIQFIAPLIYERDSYIGLQLNTSKDVQFVDAY